MLLDNQLYIRINDNAHGRMCTTVMDVCQYIYEQTRYQLTDLEYKVFSDFWNSVLPMRSFAPEEKRRTLILVDAEGNISELAYKEMKGVSKEEAVPAGSRCIGNIFSGAYTHKPAIVAAFDFGTKDNSVVLTISRKISNKSQTLYLADELWRQQAAHFRNPLIPEVKADLSPYKGPIVYEKNDANSYTLKVGEETFPIHSEKDLIAVVSVLIGHQPTEIFCRFVSHLFYHFATFPKGIVFSPGIRYYVDTAHGIYVGGNGTNRQNVMEYGGQFLAGFFTGQPGGVVSIQIAAFEGAMIKLLLVRD